MRRVAAGAFLRQHRERLRARDRAFSLRKVAERVGIEPSYLSKVEREVVPPPGEEVMILLARDLGIHPDLLLAMGGRVATELREVILRRPVLFGALLRELAARPDDILADLVHSLRD